MKLTPINFEFYNMTFQYGVNLVLDQFTYPAWYSIANSYFDIRTVLNRLSIVRTWDDVVEL